MRRWSAAWLLDLAGYPLHTPVARNNFSSPPAHPYRSARSDKPPAKTRSRMVPRVPSRPPCASGRPTPKFPARLKNVPMLSSVPKGLSSSLGDPQAPPRPRGHPKQPYSLTAESPLPARRRILCVQLGTVSSRHVSLFLLSVTRYLFRFWTRLNTLCLLDITR